MTQELANKLIKHFQEVIKLIKKSPENRRDEILIKTSTQKGICHCSIMVFKEDLLDDEWVESKNQIGGCYWENTPIYETKEEAIRLLEYRVTILKTFKEDESSGNRNND